MTVPELVAFVAIVLGPWCVVWTFQLVRAANDWRERRRHWRLCEFCARDAGRPWPPSGS